MDQDPILLGAVQTQNKGTVHAQRVYNLAIKQEMATDRQKSTSKQ